MSGGAFNYLHIQDTPSPRDLKEMGEYLHSLGYTDAAGATFNLIPPPVEPKLLALWQAVEWYASGDYGIDQVAEAYRQYRSES